MTGEPMIVNEGMEFNVTKGAVSKAASFRPFKWNGIPRSCLPLVVILSMFFLFSVFKCRLQLNHLSSRQKYTSNKTLRRGLMSPPSTCLTSFPSELLMHRTDVLPSTPESDSALMAGIRAAARIARVFTFIRIWDARRCLSFRAGALNDSDTHPRCRDRIPNTVNADQRRTP